MRQSDIISGAVLAILGLLTIYVIVPDQISGSSDFGIAPDVFPLTLIWATTAFAVLLVVGRLVQSRDRREPGAETPPIIRPDWFFIAGATLFMAGGFIAIAYLSFIAGGIIMLVLLMLLMGERRHLLRVGLVAAIVPAGLYLVFWHLFRVPLP